MNKRKGFWYGASCLLIVLVTVLSGCTEREQVMVPPRADLQGAKSIAVLYLENFSEDPGLHYEIEQGIARYLRGYYQVADQAAVDSALHSLGVRRGSPITTDHLRELGQKLNVDAVVVGEITYYFEDVSMKMPEMGSTYDEGKKVRWTSGYDTTVLVNMNGRVVSTKTGVVLYSKRASGEHSSSSSQLLSWTSPEPPPDSFLPRPSRRDVPEARQRAVQDVVESFTVDLLPTYVWRKVE